MDDLDIGSVVSDGTKIGVVQGIVLTPPRMYDVIWSDETRSIAQRHHLSVANAEDLIARAPKSQAAKWYATSRKLPHFTRKQPRENTHARRTA